MSEVCTHIDQVVLQELPASVDGCEDCLLVRVLKGLREHLDGDVGAGDERLSDERRRSGDDRRGRDRSRLEDVHRERDEYGAARARDVK